MLCPGSHHPNTVFKKLLHELYPRCEMSTTLAAGILSFTGLGYIRKGAFRPFHWKSTTNFTEKNSHGPTRTDLQMFSSCYLFMQSWNNIMHPKQETHQNSRPLLPFNVREIRKPSSVINGKKQRKTTEWERLEISSRELEIPRKYFMQRWAR